MDVFDKYLGVHATALSARSRRLELIASNIANAATPGYKARDVDFAAALRDAGSTGALATTSAQQIARAGHARGTYDMYRVPLQASLDGNTVELATEQTMFAENAVHYQTTLSFLNGRLATLKSALKGE